MRFLWELNNINITNITTNTIKIINNKYNNNKCKVYKIVTSTTQDIKKPSLYLFITWSWIGLDRKSCICRGGFASSTGCYPQFQLAISLTLILSLATSMTWFLFLLPSVIPTPNTPRKAFITWPHSCSLGKPCAVPISHCEVKPVTSKGSSLSPSKPAGKVWFALGSGKGKLIWTL